MAWLACLFTKPGNQTNWPINQLMPFHFNQTLIQLISVNQSEFQFIEWNWALISLIHGQFGLPVSSLLVIRFWLMAEFDWRQSNRKAWKKKRISEAIQEKPAIALAVEFRLVLQSHLTAVGFWNWIPKFWIQLKKSEGS